MAVIYYFYESIYGYILKTLNIDKLHKNPR